MERILKLFDEENQITAHVKQYNCFIGSELCSFLVQNHFSASREEAVHIGQLLLNQKKITSMTHSSIFRDGYHLYQPIPSQAEPKGALKKRVLILELEDDCMNEEAAFSLPTTTHFRQSVIPAPEFKDLQTPKDLKQKHTRTSTNHTSTKNTHTDQNAVNVTPLLPKKTHLKRFPSTYRRAEPPLVKKNQSSPVVLDLVRDSQEWAQTDAHKRKIPHFDELPSQDLAERDLLKRGYSWEFQNKSYWHINRIENWISTLPPHKGVFPLPDTDDLDTPLTNDEFDLRRELRHCLGSFADDHLTDEEMDYEPSVDTSQSSHRLQSQQSNSFSQNQAQQSNYFSQHSNTFSQNQAQQSNHFSQHSNSFSQNQAQESNHFSNTFSQNQAQQSNHFSQHSNSFSQNQAQQSNHFSQHSNNQAQESNHFSQHSNSFSQNQAQQSNHFSQHSNTFSQNQARLSNVVFQNQNPIPQAKHFSEFVLPFTPIKKTDLSSLSDTTQTLGNPQDQESPTKILMELDPKFQPSPFVRPFSGITPHSRRDSSRGGTQPHSEQEASFQQAQPSWHSYQFDESFNLMESDDDI